MTTNQENNVQIDNEGRHNINIQGKNITSALGHQQKLTNFKLGYQLEATQDKNGSQIESNSKIPLAIIGTTKTISETREMYPRYDQSIYLRDRSWIQPRDCKTIVSQG